jgi:hypothetical protein
MLVESLHRSFVASGEVCIVQSLVVRHVAGIV